MTRLRGKTILIVEDESLIALDMIATLHAEGADVIPARNVLEAFTIIQNINISAAVLDVKLADANDCAPICYLLEEKQVPFVFHTGYTTGGVLDEYPKASILIKPATKAQLVDCVLGSMGTRRIRRYC